MNDERANIINPIHKYHFTFHLYNIKHIIVRLHKLNNNLLFVNVSTLSTLIMNTDTQYIYLLIVREFIKTGEPIFKIGKTTQTNDKRFKQYPKDSILLLQLICQNCDLMEKEMIHIFRGKYMQRKDIGTEYFQGDYTDMIQTMYSVWITFDAPSMDEEEPENRTIEIQIREWLAYIRTQYSIDIHTNYKEMCEYFVLWSRIQPIHTQLFINRFKKIQDTGITLDKKNGRINVCIHII